MGTEVAISKTGDLAPRSEVLPQPPKPPQIDLPVLAKEAYRTGLRNKQWQITRLTEAERLSVQAVLAQLDDLLSPATREEIRNIMIRQVNHHRNQRTDLEWQMLGEDYYDDLEEFSAIHIAEAVRQHRRHCGWFPKLNELRALLVPMKICAEEQRRRCRVLLGIQKPHFLDVPEEDDPGPARDMTAVLVVLNGMRVE